MIKEAPFKKPFLTGLVTLLPVILSIVIIIIILNCLIYYIGLPIGQGILSIIQDNSILNTASLPDNYIIATLVGLFTVSLAIIVIGYLASLSGERITESIKDGALGKLPFIRMFYPYTKQIANFICGKGKKDGFKKVVMVEYPKDGIYTIGFLTSDNNEPISNVTGIDCVSVFIPSSPTPFTGYTIFVPKEKAFSLSISVNEALRLLVSGGVLTPVQPGQNIKYPKEKVLTIYPTPAKALINS